MVLGLPPHSQKLFSGFHPIANSDVVNNVLQNFNGQGVVHQSFQFAVVSNVVGCLHCFARFRWLRDLSLKIVNNPDYNKDEVKLISLTIWKEAVKAQSRFRAGISPDWLTKTTSEHPSG